ncbi:MAG TPA: 1-acyl-sn-glycerol-3-phosphate acyltransferase [Chryseolinea sp.]
MTRVFLFLYEFFLRRKPLFWILFLATLSLIGIGASRITLEEDITKFFPDDERVERLNYVFQNSKFVERIVVMVSVRDSSNAPEPDSLVSFAASLSARMDKDLKPFIKQLTTQIDEEKVMGLFTTIHDHLPIFLDENDYQRLDSIIQPKNVEDILMSNYRQLISPAGVVVKKIIVKDPLGFSFLALEKLKQLQYDENFELYDGYIITKDHRHLIFFVSPAFPPSETGNNSRFVSELDDLINALSPAHPDLKVSYFGAPVVAVGNAQQLRKDTILTVSMVIIFLAVFLIGFFRKKRVPFLIFIPVAVGALFSLCCIYLLKGSISILAIAAGSVILGIAVNYSLHFLSHLKHTHDIKVVIEDLVRPMTIGSATTVVAFFCLQFANAAVLRDVGLFAGFSLIGAALCSLIFLPHFISEGLFPRTEPEGWMERVSFSVFESNRYLAFLILLATPFFLFFAREVKFNSDMGKLNFMREDVKEAQQRLEAINQSSLTSVYVVSDGNDLQSALELNEQVGPALSLAKTEKVINKYATVSTFLISDSLQKIRLRRWKEYWKGERKERILNEVRQKGTELKFAPQVITNFDSLLSKDYQLAGPKIMGEVREAFFDDYIIEKNGAVTVISLANVSPANKEALYARLENSSVHAFDRQMLTNLFVEYVNADFNFIVTFTAILVFFALLLLYGRIELTLITFVPMLITWIWILGIMALVGIEFNIINVIVSTFIFGLGDDYSIFTMDGLLQEYRVGKKNLSSIRTSIFLSAITTIAGLGVLIFASHPALRSIAAISIIGITCVFLMSQTIEPFLFRWLVTSRVQKGFTPMTLHGILRTTFTYTLFVFGAIFLTVVGLIFRLIPFGKKAQKACFHFLLRWFAFLCIYVEPTVIKKIIGQRSDTFSQANVIVANHSSFLDILLTIMLHPKLILVTNKWVWNSPVFGSVVRLADYYPVSEGTEDGMESLTDKIREGYSIVIFPEGTRSPDGVINRFHKGAFYIAEKFRLPVLPLLIHGASDAIPKGSFYLNAGQLTLKFLPPIRIDDENFGDGYAERTKRISRYFKQEFASLKKEIETPRYFSHKLISNYIYKGPVLEWYLRVKLRLEKFYLPFHELLPANGNILDLGCGYGFLCYMLQFLSDQRAITGVDYDEEKIDVADHGYLKSKRLKFFCSDVTKFPLEKYDGIIISDVLHYLSPEAQVTLLHRAMDALNAGGTLLVREGNSDLKDRHKGTRVTEFFSVKLLKFNKSTNELNFLSAETIKAAALEKGLALQVYDDAKYTSNVIFVIRKN